MNTHTLCSVVAAAGKVALFCLVTVSVTAATGSLDGAAAKVEKTVKATTRSGPSLHQIPLDRLQRDEKTDARANYLSDRLISPLQPTVIRQDSPEGPKYKEAIEYTFLLYSTKFPSVVRMDSGRLIMNVSYEGQAGNELWVFLFSDDDGRTWTKPVPSPLGRSTLVNLGGGRLMSFVGELRFSEDAGKTWSQPETLPPIPDGRPLYSDVPYTHLVEGQTVTFLGYVEEQPGYAHWEDSNSIWTRAVMRRYHLDTHKWDEPYLFPMAWGLGEGSITRAQNGDLVAAFRTQMQDGTRIDNDAWMGIATTRSSDNGKTWEKPVQAFDYGHVHVHLLRLPDGRILMTYAARIGELDGLPYHGIEAVFSHDHGKTWDWAHRFILFRWAKSPTMHSPSSVLLSDGSILTTFQHDCAYSWDDGTVGPISLKKIGNVSSVIWKP